MSFKVMADNNRDILAKEDGALYNVALNNQDMIIKGLGQEMVLGFEGLVVTVGTGEAIIHGRHVVANESNQLTLPQNESGYLVLRIDLTQSVGNEALLYATPVLTKNEINWGNGIYDMELAKFTTNGISINSLTDLRFVGDNALDKRLNGLTIIDLTQEEYNNMGSGRPSRTLYAIVG